MVSLLKVRVSAGVIGCVVVLSGCAPSPPAPAPPATEHIHELAFDRADDALLVATHTGIFRIDLVDGSVEGPPEGLALDAMGLVVAGDSAYLSGHPGPTTLPELVGPNLGILESTDGARSWTPLALAGEADFHALAVSIARPSRIYGLYGETLHRSDDAGVSWTEVSSLQARDLLAPAGDDGLLYATTAQGLMVSRDGGASFEAVANAPALLLVADGAVPDGRLVGVDTEGIIWYQSEAGGEWLEGGTVQGQPAALTVVPASGVVLVADDRGVVSSDDFGGTWSVIWPSSEALG